MAVLREMIGLSRGKVADVVGLLEISREPLLARHLFYHDAT